jgi:hypothetical protein
VCSFQVIPKPLAISCTTSATKAGPLSDPIDTGILNWGMISFYRHLATSWTFSVWVGKTSTHPEKVQTNNSTYLHPLAHDISVKSTIRFSKGVLPTLCTWGSTLGPCWTLFMSHTAALTYCLSYAGEIGVIRMLSQESCLPWVSFFMELLVKCGC